MKHKDNRNCEYSKMDYNLVVSAVNGDLDALSDVIRFFKPVIQKKAVRPVMDDCGRCGFYVDPFVFGHIENELIKAILSYKKYL